MKNEYRLGFDGLLAILAIICALTLACSESSDSGGMSGTGLSQGTIDSFGSIFVNGVEWEIGSAQIDLDGTAAGEADLRLGMVVTVRGDRDAGGVSGSATSVTFDDEVEGPIENTPVAVGTGGTQKRFNVLGRLVLIDSVDTVFANGADFATIARDDVVEVSGFVDGVGTILATRVELRGVFPTLAEVGLEGVVSNLVQNGDGTGVFDLGTIMIEYDAMTVFRDFREPALMNGTTVDVKGTLVGGGTDRVDAMRIELEDGFDGDDIPEFEIEGIVSDRVSNADFEVAGIPVDASGATFIPVGLIVANGDRVDVEGELVSGLLIASEVKLEDEDLEDVRIDAAISSIDSGARTITLLGVVVEVETSARLEDDRDELVNFGFDDLVVGDWVALRGVQTGPGQVSATRLERESPDDDVQLEGPVTALDRIARSLEILDQPIPIDGGTLYFDALDQLRTETQFFETPGDVDLGVIVRARDQNATDNRALLEADEIEIEIESD